MPDGGRRRERSAGQGTHGPVAAGNGALEEPRAGHPLTGAVGPVGRRRESRPGSNRPVSRPLRHVRRRDWPPGGRGTGAARSSRRAMLEVLLPAHPDLTIRNRYGGVSVIPASERGHVAYVRRVVRTGIDVNHVNDLGWTALLEAVILGDGSPPYRKIVRALLEAGADPSVADTDGVTVLEHAESRGQAAVAAIVRRAS
ncbi:MAG: ankyrin repeat domain-containing protein [Nocardioides sp.]